MIRIMINKRDLKVNAASKTQIMRGIVCLHDLRVDRDFYLYIERPTSSCDLGLNVGPSKRVV